MTACQLVRSRIDHTRHGRPSHFLSRRGLSIWIDLDRLEVANSESGFFSVDRFNLLSFHQSDYGPNFRSRRPMVPLAEYARELAREICPGVEIASVSLLTFPRILGVAFNPVSIYLLRDWDGADAMYIYEVRNTFGDMHSYVGRAANGEATLEAQKIFHVSPFFPVSGEYRLRMHAREDSDQVRVLMRYSDAGAARLTATLRGTREKLTNLGVIRAMAATGQWPLRPLISIHVEAARLWWKRVPFHSRPEPPNSWSRADDIGSR
ncbi:MAG: DUF1365 domain-containing protein [Pseudomonadota bacterium]|nr:DUF1365 domain-containing protein [Pseudomonadota bacterium]